MPPLKAPPYSCFAQWRLLVPTTVWVPVLDWMKKTTGFCTWNAAWRTQLTVEIHEVWGCKSRCLALLSRGGPGKCASSVAICSNAFPQRWRSAIRKDLLARTSWLVSAPQKTQHIHSSYPVPRQSSIIILDPLTLQPRKLKNGEKRLIGVTNHYID